MVSKASPVVIWNTRASISFKKSYLHIKKESPSNAEKVRAGIVKVVDSLLANPQRFSPDKFKKDNPGNYRAFEKYSFRIAYKHTEKEIRVLRIRHVKQEPRAY